ncbi:hypothetical protein PGUG_00796 [Meyerozyma guilliermondii ATCC 6260]|uniref:Uncharacterized protein n=1 Tax=Meyerozyma guilliermondii (strain ATCC 6260 / CBS 566 / DSM 6381 / JCM 1539 / NBRC 10279 / NRRL Y-324) TaxID=294746 RepID=A5DBZ1_PICGU|nr:uncharacterized protein PGUG_00796 [Meyerozyma guilliermondii ATCC 6260]EDK36698.2 hypothetical protein PGUG_00796 [Meyerozyma guilliermondii ATCC 6260]
MTMVESEVAMRFDALSLGIPFEARNYEHIPLFLSRALNLPDKMKILDTQNINKRSKDEVESRRNVTEILPDIAIASDAWLRDDVTIKDVKAKTPILEDINNMLENEYLRSTSSGDDALFADDGALTYYEKIIAAYNFLELPQSIDTEPIYASQPMSLQEEDEDNEFGEESTLGSSPVIRTRSNQSSSNSLRNTNVKRSPGANSRKRFSMFLGNMNEPTVNGNDQHSTSSPEEPETVKKQGFLQKSKLYNKIKKTRDSHSSFSSVISSPNSFTNSSRSSYSATNRNSTAASNRNSVSTSMTSHSNASRRRTSTTLPSTPIDENRVFQYQQPSPVALSPLQRQENQRDKYEYYSQLLRTKELVENYLILAERTANIRAIIRFLEFIKMYVLRMVVVDMYHLTTSCSISKAREMSRKC